MPTATEVEKMAADTLAALHMAVHRARNSTVKRGNIFVAQSNDIFGVFDILAIDPISGHLYLYQVTRSRGAASSRRKKIVEWVDEHDFRPYVFKTMSIGILIYATSRSRIDPRKVDRFFYREHYIQKWIKLEPLGG